MLCLRRLWLVLASERQRGSLTCAAGSRVGTSLQLALSFTSDKKKGIFDRAPDNAPRKATCQISHPSLSKGLHFFWSVLFPRKAGLEIGSLQEWFLPSLPRVEDLEQLPHSLHVVRNNAGVQTHIALPGFYVLELRFLCKASAVVH